MVGRLSYSLVLGLFAARLNAQLPNRTHVRIDSVVLVRTPVPGWPCPTCPPARVVLRRDAIDSTTLAAIKQKADSIGFYDLPPNVMGASFCPVVRSDALMATLSIYHPDGRWSVRGYHHCTDRSPQQVGLLALEAMVDGIAGVPRREF